MPKSKIIFWVILGLLAILIGFRYHFLSKKFRDDNLNQYINSGEKATFQGEVVKEPDIRDVNTKLTIKARLPERDRALKLLITTGRYPKYKYGDILEITGNLEKPAVFEDFNYKNYLKAKKINFVAYYPSVKLISRGPFSGISYVYSKILDFKNKLRKNLYSSISPPQSYILGAMILGDKDKISNDFKEKLNISGLRHLTAVSGLHIVIISSVFLSLFLFLGFWRKQAVHASLVFIFLFIALTGFQISSIRAGIMGSLFLLAPLFGRNSCSMRSLIIVGGAMLIINPFLFFYDVGFQLSFLAAMGIIYLSSTFKKYLKSDILAATFSAYIFTLPILIYSFGRISLVSFLTNFLVLPIIPVVMVLGFIASILGLFIFFIPVWFLLTYIVKITEIFSQPCFAQEFINIHWIWLILSYFLLIPIAWYFNKREFRL